MEISLVGFIVVCTFFYVAGGVSGYFILKNNPGLLDRWMRFLQVENEKLKKELEELKGKVGL